MGAGGTLSHFQLSSSQISVRPPLIHRAANVEVTRGFEDPLDHRLATESQHSYIDPACLFLAQHGKRLAHHRLSPATRCMSSVESVSPQIMCCPGSV